MRDRVSSGTVACSRVTGEALLPRAAVRLQLAHLLVELDDLRLGMRGWREVVEVLELLLALLVGMLCARRCSVRCPGSRLRPLPVGVRGIVLHLTWPSRRDRGLAVARLRILRRGAVAWIPTLRMGSGRGLTSLSVVGAHLRGSTRLTRTTGGWPLRRVHWGTGS